MAQIEDPTEILKIEGEALEKLQNTYRQLYYEPGFALTEQQKVERDELFNEYVVRLISQTAMENRDNEEERRRGRQQVRAREVPRS